MRSFILVHRAFEERPIWVAQFDDLKQTQLSNETICEMIFALTQNLEESWLDVIARQKDCFATINPVLKNAGGCRSTSVGDHIQVFEGGKQIATYKVAGMGFEKI